MTKLLDQALEAVRDLPPDVQDDIARIVLELAGSGDARPVPLSDDERTAIEGFLEGDIREHRRTAFEALVRGKAALTAQVAISSPPDAENEE